LGNNGNVSTRPPHLIGKLTFVCLSNMKKKKLEKLAQGLFGKTIIIRDRLAKGGRRLDLKLKHEFMKLLKRKIII
jgi:hypothetical protein